MKQHYFDSGGNDCEVIAVLTAISQVSARMARNMTILAQQTLMEDVNVRKTDRKQVNKVGKKLRFLLLHGSIPSERIPALGLLEQRILDLEERSKS